MGGSPSCGIARGSTERRELQGTVTPCAADLAVVETLWMGVTVPGGIALEEAF